jgi:hypothetical protein
MKLNTGYKSPVWFMFGVGLAGLLVACAAPAVSGEIKSEKQRQSVVAGKDKITELVAGNSDFAFDLFQELGGEGGNIFYL